MRGVVVCSEVLEGYREIARFTGNKSQDKKVNHITKMLRRCSKDGHEAKYLIRGEAHSHSKSTLEKDAWMSFDPCHHHCA